MTKTLGHEQLEQFHRDGFLVVPGFLKDEEVKRLQQRADELVNAFDASYHPISLFTVTGESTKAGEHSEDEYFLTSGDKIRYFLETKSVDPSDPGVLRVAPHRSVNKIGHGLHMVDPVCRSIILDPSIQDIARQLEFVDPRVLQSMYIFKQPGIGGEGTFLFFIYERGKGRGG